MSSLNRKMRRQHLVKATSRDETIIATAQRLLELEKVVESLINTLLESSVLKDETEGGGDVILPVSAV